MSRRLVALASSAALAVTGLGVVVGAPAASAATVTQAYQCQSSAFGATELLPPQDLAVSISMPANVTVGSSTDVAQVTVAAASGSTLPLSPQVTLDDVELSLQVRLELVTTSNITPPAASSPANGVATGAGATESLGTVAPESGWSVSAPVPVPLGVPGVLANDIVWARPSTLTYAWTADGAAGSTTCVPVDDSVTLPASTVSDPIWGWYPAAKAPFVSETTTALPGPVTTVNSCSTPPCSITEPIEGEVNPGALTLTQQNNLVVFPTVTLSGVAQDSSAPLNQQTIVDARGNGAPWTLTASMTDFSNTTQLTGGNRVIPATALSWTPTCTPVTALPDSVVDGGSGAFIAGAGSVNGNPTTASRVLCDHPVETGGGTWTADASMTLTVPPNIRTGLYKATMFLTIA